MRNCCAEMVQAIKNRPRGTQRGGQQSSSLDISRDIFVCICIFQTCTCQSKTNFVCSSRCHPLFNNLLQQIATPYHFYVLSKRLSFVVYLSFVTNLRSCDSHVVSKGAAILFVVGNFHHVMVCDPDHVIRLSKMDSTAGMKSTLFFLFLVIAWVSRRFLL